MRHLILSCSSLALVAGCADDLAPAALIERTRVLGARVEVDGDADRAQPRPGETAIVDWIIATPAGAAPRIGWAFVACAGACDGEPLALVTGDDAAPSLRLAIPAGLAVGTTIAVSGVVCEDGTPTLAAGDAVPGCTGGGAIATPIRLSITVAGEAANRNPTLGALAVRDRAWTDGGGCGAPTAMTVAAGAELQVRWSAADDREAFVDRNGGGTREALVLAMFATAGDVGDHHAVIEATDDTLVRELAWTAPAADELPAGGATVGFTFVIRDGRGGLAAASRAVCVAP